MTEPVIFPEIEIRNVEKLWDNRGYLVQPTLPMPIVHQFMTYSTQNVIRGLHWQTEPFETWKIVYPINGTIYDIVVDIRKGSETFGKWMGYYLRFNSPKQIDCVCIPPGFAHGFRVNSQDVLVMYNYSNIWVQSSVKTLLWNDKDIGIDWHITAPYNDIIISENDAKGMTLNEYKQELDRG